MNNAATNNKKAGQTTSLTLPPTDFGFPELFRFPIFPEKLGNNPAISQTQWSYLVDRCSSDLEPHKRTADRLNLSATVSSGTHNTKRYLAHAFRHRKKAVTVWCVSSTQHVTTHTSHVKCVRSISASAVLTWWSHYQQMTVQTFCCNRIVHYFGSCIMLQSRCFWQKTPSSSFRVKVI